MRQRIHVRNNINEGAEGEKVRKGGHKIRENKGMNE